MSIYSKLLNHANEGGGYHVDLKKKSLKIGNQYCIKDGIVKVDDALINKEDLINIAIRNEPWDIASDLYDCYKYSIPNARYRDNSYFKALKYEELDNYALAYGYPRHYAQAILEGYILLASISGWLKWQNDKHWFWQDPLDKEFIILKEYI